MNNPDKSVARIISVAIVAVLAIVLTVFGILIDDISSDRWRKQLHDEETLIADQLAVSLALPLWNFDHGQMDKIMDSAMQNKAVFSIAVTPNGSNERMRGRGRDSEWRTIESSGAVVPKGMLLQERDIFFRNERIGKVSIAVTPRFLEEFLKENRRLILLIIIPCLLILASLLYLALWRLVVLPLKEVEAFAMAVSSEKETGIPVMKTRFYGELENVRQSLMKMVAMLRSRYKDLQGEMVLRQASEEQFRLLFDGAADAVFVHDGEGRIVDANSVGCDSLGYTRDELLLKSVSDFEQSFQAADLVRLWKRISSGVSVTVEGTHRRFDGSTFPVEVRIAPFAAGGRPLFFAAARDITERKCSEERLRLSEERFRTLIENAPLAIGIGRDGTNLYANGKYLKMFGFERLDQIVGQPIAGHWSPEWRALITDRALQRSMGLHVPTEYEAVAQRADGSQFPAQITVTVMDLPDGRATVGFITDLTERKKLEEQLIQSQKMESIGRLAGGIAHDFNNLLTPIFGYSEMLKKKTAEDSPDRGKFDSIIMAADRARVLTQQLLSFSRKQVLEMKTVNLNHVITSFYDILRRTVREDVEIRLLLTDNQPCIKADKNQIEQILMNLVVNAQHAIRYNGIITLETVPVTLDDEFVCQHAVVTAGNYVMLVVSDTGCGMDEETLSRIFEPFFTTKGSEGTGLGLATVYGLAKQHNGFIWVYSEVGKGTVFKLYFPIVAENPHIRVPEAQERPVLNAKGRTILLVEDNAMVRGLVFEFLVGQGFTVLVGEDPEEAMKASEGKHIDLMVSDVVMPGMNGPQLYQRLLLTHPDLKVLYMSGYTDNTIVRHGVLEEGVNFIQKPFSVNDLAKRIEERLSGA